MVDFNFPVSLFKNYYDPTPLRTIPLMSFFTCHNKGLSDKVEIIRNSPSKEIRDKKKAELPCITVSGCFSTRLMSKMISHSGLICLDIDNLGPGGVEAAREKILSLEYAAMVGKSVSGAGLFFIAEIAEPKHHGEHFDWIQKDVLERTGLVLDKACRDTTRLRGYTMDPSLAVRMEATKVTGRIAQEDFRTVRSKSSGSNRDQLRFFQLLRLIDELGVDITQDRQDWIKIGTGIASEFGDDGYPYFEEISSNYSGFSVAECRKQWRSLMKGSGRTSINSVFYIADKYGVRLNG